MSFSEFSQRHSCKDLARLFDFYTVFEGFEEAEFCEDLSQSIRVNLLENYAKIKADLEFDKDTNFALLMLAKNKLKRYSINRKLGHFKAQSIVNSLLNSGILSLEKSLETKPTLSKGQRLKKCLKNYTIQDKLVFKDNFTRFFFRFLKPNEDLIKAKEFDRVLELIFKDFEHYQSLCFELLSKELLQKKFSLKQVSSFWQRDIELDLYYKDEDLCLLGEVKFKNRKICKNIFNLLQGKARALNIKPDFYIIFSKSGFSNEFERKKERNLLLFELDDCKELLL
ncbi:hypothetical protein DMC01_08770 [Campylobacter troglodytis]|nr:hypothetical protein DMC01_08770 [Campylobacter troglodytis]